MSVKIRQDETILAYSLRRGLKRETLSRFKGASSETAARSIALPRSRGFSSATTADVYSAVKPEWSRGAFFTARDKDVWNIGFILLRPLARLTSLARRRLGKIHTEKGKENEQRNCSRKAKGAASVIRAATSADCFGYLRGFRRL